MNLDPAAVSDDFYHELATRRIAILSHTGESMGLGLPDALDAYAGPRRLRRAVELGVEVVMLHLGRMGTNAVVTGRSYARRVLRRGRVPPRARRRSRRAVRRALRRFRPTPAPAGLRRMLPSGRLVNGSDYPAVTPWFVVGKTLKGLVNRGYLTADQRPRLREIFRYNPLLFDFVLKRTLRIDGRPLPETCFLGLPDDSTHPPPPTPPRPRHRLRRRPPQTLPRLTHELRKRPRSGNPRRPPAPDRRLRHHLWVGQPTVVLLPGGMGSHLERSTRPYRNDASIPFEAYDPVWMDLEIFFGRDAAALRIQDNGHDEGDYIVVPNGPLRFLVDAYDGTQRFFRDRGWNYLVFGYDWRRPIAEAAAQFESFLGNVHYRVKELRDADPLPTTTLLAHSQGGLVAKVFLHRVGGSDGSGVARWCERLVTVGTPFYGTASHHDRYYVGQPPLNTFYGTRFIADLAGSLPAPTSS